MRGALAAGVTPIAVTTGPCSREELAAAGAEVIFDSLEEFPGWFSAFGAPEPVR